MRKISKWYPAHGRSHPAVFPQTVPSETPVPGRLHRPGSEPGSPTGQFPQLFHRRIMKPSLPPVPIVLFFHGLQAKGRKFLCKLQHIHLTVPLKNLPQNIISFFVNSYKRNFHIFSTLFAGFHQDKRSKLFSGGLSPETRQVRPSAPRILPPWGAPSLLRLIHPFLSRKREILGSFFRRSEKKSVFQLTGISSICPGWGSACR